MFFKASFSSNTYILDSNITIEIGAKFLYVTFNSSEEITSSKVKVLEQCENNISVKSFVFISDISCYLIVFGFQRDNCRSKGATDLLAPYLFPIEENLQCQNVAKNLQYFTHDCFS